LKGFTSLEFRLQWWGSHVGNAREPEEAKMKWTMITVAAMGLATYGVILLAQLQHREAPEPSEHAHPMVAPTEPFEEVVVAPATIEEVVVSEAEKVDEVETPRWNGDPWTAGVRAFEERNDDLAVAALKAAVAEREDSSYRHYVLALALRRTAEIEAAVVELERSLELSPGAAKSWIALARCELDRGETVAAREAVDAALEIDIDSGDAWHLLGRVELAEGAAPHAEAAFQKALERDADHAWAANNLGYARILQERFDEALAPLQEAVASGADEPVFFNNLGIALERSGHPELAALSFAHAVVLGHGPAEVSMGRVETSLEQEGRAFAAVDSVEFIGSGDLAARVEQAVLLVAVEVEDEALVEPELVAANENPESEK
jgi:tetratricopeptide (TPR) repeat protein